MTFLLVCFAVWRISHFIAEEDGPGHFMWDIRYHFQKRFLGGLISCVSCNSVWVSLFVTPFCFSENRVIYWLAVSAAVMFMEAIYGRLRMQQG